MTTYDHAYQGAADQVESNFTEQMALNQLDTEKEVRMNYVSRTKFVPRSLRLEIEGYGTRIPAFGSVAAAYHTPGTVLLGLSDSGNQNIRTGMLDDRIVAHVAEDEYDAKQRASINFRPARNRALGVAIARMDETQAAIMAVLAARASATVSGGPSGGAVTGAGAGSNATALAALIWAAKTAMDLNELDEMNRFLALSYGRYNLLASQLLYLSNRELGNDGSMTGMVRVAELAGFEVFGTNYLPSTNISSGTTGQRNTYTGDFRQTIGVAFQEEAFTTLVPLSELPMGGKGNAGITTQKQPTSPVNVREVNDQRAFSTLKLASLISGHCVCRPEAAIELKDSTL